MTISMEGWLLTAERKEKWFGYIGNLFSLMAEPFTASDLQVIGRQKGEKNLNLKAAMFMSAEKEAAYDMLVCQQTTRAQLDEFLFTNRFEDLKEGLEKVEKAVRGVVAPERLPLQPDFVRQIMAA